MAISAAAAAGQDARPAGGTIAPGGRRTNRVLGPVFDPSACGADKSPWKKINLNKVTIIIFDICSKCANNTRHIRKQPQSVSPMTNFLRDQRSSLMPRHAGVVTLAALAVIAVGILVGLGAVDLYETANSWVLRA